MATVFDIVDRSGTTLLSHGITASVATIKAGLLVARDTAGVTVSLAGSSGSQPLGVVYGSRDMVYAPTSVYYGIGEPLTVAIGHMVVRMSADLFSTGSLPAGVADTKLYAAANGLFDISGTNYVGRILMNKSITLPTGGTGTSQNTVLAELVFGVS